MSKIIDKTRELAEEIVQKYDIELVDVEYVTENKNKILRIYIHKPSGISLDDCQKVHLDLNEVIDDYVDIPGGYYLEVSSPGYDRALKYEKDFLRYTGSRISVKLYAPVDGKKTFEGILKNYDNGVIKLETEEGTIDIDIEKTSKIKRVFEL